MLTRRSNSLSSFIGIAAVALAVGWAGVGPATAEAPGVNGLVTTAVAVDPIVGQWEYQGGIVEVTGSGSSYVGRIVKATSFNQCTHPVGQQMWTINGSGGSYSGTHVGVNLADCSDLRMTATWSLTDNGDGTYSLRLCAEAGCATLHRAVPLDTTPPDVELDVPTGVVPRGRTFKVRWSVTDDSGEAKMTMILYSNGNEVAGFSETTGLAEATGKAMQGTVSPVTGAPGPFYLCVSAEDAAGNKSVNWPQTECKMLSIEVALDQFPDVANGCGGAGSWWPVSAQNWMLDTKKFGGHAVNFRLACIMHDAGYAGVTAYDPFSKKLIDFRKKSRLWVDNKFFDDLAALCHRDLDGKHVSGTNMHRCTKGVSLDNVLFTEMAFKSPGALAYWEGVRRYAESAFDTNPTLPGTQTTNRPETWPEGVGRSNR